VYCNNGGLYSEIQGHQLQNLSAIEAIVREIGIGEIVDGLLSRSKGADHLHLTPSPVNKNGKKRRVLIESRPEFAIVKLNGIERAISNRIGADLRNRDTPPLREFASGSPSGAAA
jgi:hypothetical protein